MQSYIVVLRHVISFFLNVMFIYRRYRRTHSEYVKLGKPYILQLIICMLWVFDYLAEVTVICIHACISYKSVAPIISTMKQVYGINCFKFFIGGRVYLSHKIFNIPVAIFCYLFLILFPGIVYFFLFVQILTIMYCLLSVYFLIILQSVSFISAVSGYLFCTAIN